MPAPTPTTGRRALLLAVAATMSAAAALAIGILLFGDFGGTEGRVLGTTLLLAVHGALAVPAAILRDQRRLAAVAGGCAALVALSAALTVIAVWWAGGSDTYGKALSTVLFFLIPAVVATALLTRPLHVLFAPFVAVSALAASMATITLWAEYEGDGWLRLLGAVVVLDVLLVGLQPLLLRARRHDEVRPLRVADTSGRTVDVVVSAETLPDAVAQAIRSAEREGRHVRSVEVLERVDSNSNGSHPR